jgi:hypothetical protein
MDIWFEAPEPGVLSIQKPANTRNQTYGSSNYENCLIPGICKGRKIKIMPDAVNRYVVEVHGCIVCARMFNILAIYGPDNKLINSKVTSSNGHIVPDKHRPLVACNIHTASITNAAYKKMALQLETK